MTTFRPPHPFPGRLPNRLWKEYRRGRGSRRTSRGGNGGTRQEGKAGGGKAIIPLILYSPVSWLLLLRTLRAEDALDPTVSTLSKPGCAGSALSDDESEAVLSSCGIVRPGRRAKGLRMGMLGWSGVGCENESERVRGAPTKGRMTSSDGSERRRRLKRGTKWFRETKSWERWETGDSMQTLLGGVNQGKREIVLGGRRMGLGRTELC